MSAYCPKCKSLKITKYGKKMFRGESVQRYQCQNCGRVWHD